jgi:hypothetical protein
VKYREAPGAKCFENPLYRVNARPCERNVVTEQVDVSTFAAKDGLHVDDDERGVFSPELAVEGPWIGYRCYVSHSRLW